MPLLFSPVFLQTSGASGPVSQSGSAAFGGPLVLTGNANFTGVIGADTSHLCSFNAAWGSLGTRTFAILETDNIFNASQTVNIDGNGSAQLRYLQLRNTTAAANNSQQYAGVFGFAGKGWHSGSSASQDCNIGWQGRPVQGSPPTVDMVLWSGINASDTYNNEVLKINSAGTMQTPGTFLLQSAAAMAGTGIGFKMNVTNALTSGDYVIKWQNNGTDVGGLLKFSSGTYFVGPAGSCGYIDTSGNAGMILTGSTQLDFWTSGSTRLTLAAAAATLAAGVVFVNPNAIKMGGKHNVADANYTSSATADCIIAYTSITVSRTVTLTQGGSTTNPLIYIVKDQSGSAGVTITITVAMSAGNIDGAANKVINAAYGVLRIYCDGANAFTF